MGVGTRTSSTWKRNSRKKYRIFLKRRARTCGNIAATPTATSLVNFLSAQQAVLETEWPNVAARNVQCAVVPSLAEVPAVVGPLQRLIQGARAGTTVALMDRPRPQLEQVLSATLPSSHSDVRCKRPAEAEKVSPRPNPPLKRRA